MNTVYNYLAQISIFWGECSLGSVKGPHLKVKLTWAYIWLLGIGRSTVVTTCQRSCGEIMYSVVSVCRSVCQQEGSPCDHYPRWHWSVTGHIKTHSGPSSFHLPSPFRDSPVPALHPYHRGISYPHHIEIDPLDMFKLTDLDLTIQEAPLPKTCANLLTM